MGPYSNCSEFFTEYDGGIMFPVGPLLAWNSVEVGFNITLWSLNSLQINLEYNYLIHFTFEQLLQTQLL